MSQSSPSRPNIVVMHCHDLGRFLGCYGNPTVNSPNLDSLAADGVQFDQAFCTAPQCSPSRASLFTGRWPHVNGVMGLTHRNFAWDLHPDERHLGGRLREAGYHTALLGVHHESLVRPDDQVATRLGFDHINTASRATSVADNTLAHLDRIAGSEQPFYLQIGFFEPHRQPGDRDPYGTMGFIGDDLEPDSSQGIAAPAYLLESDSAREEIAELQGAVRHMDAAAGRILRRLGELGLEDNTVVLFTTDHGLALPRAKCTLYDPGLEVAMIVRYPQGGWTGGSHQDELISNLDVVPTILELLGLPAERERELHGQSFLPLLDEGAYTLREEIFGEMSYHDYYDPRRSIRTRTHKLIANFSSAPAYMDCSQSWNRRCTPKVDLAGPSSHHPPVELYDLTTDPHELSNVAEKPDNAELLHDLLARLYAWMRETGDPLLDGAITSPLHRETVEVITRG